VEADLAFGNFDIAIVDLDFCGMLQALPAGAVERGVGHGCEAQLLGQRLQYRRRHGQRVFQEGTEITHRAKLHGKTQAVVLTTLLRNQCVVAVIEMEVTNEVLG
jgi:hypothetical protein